MRLIINLFVSLCVIANGIEIKISSDSLKSINNWDKTEPYLMGLHTSEGWQYLYKKYDYQTQLSEKYGVKMLAYNRNMGDGLLPDKNADVVSCCSTAPKFKSYISTPKACQVFSKGGWQPIWGDEYLREKTDIKTYLYAHDTCQAGDPAPQRSHCYALNNHGWGVPKNDDGWWNWMFVAHIGCALDIDPKLKYFHIWNEPNAVYSSISKTGEDYAQFYFQVAKAIKSRYPQVQLAGPVTWCTPLWSKAFEEWFVPLMKKVVDKGRTDLLDYIDFHAYTNRGAPWARWDLTVASCHTVTLYYNGLTNGKKWIRSQITETNVALNEAEVNNKWTYWGKRVIENAKQIMALSHNTDKLNIRIQFTMGAGFNGEGDKSKHYGWEPYTDKYMQDIIKPVQEGYPVHFEFDDIKEGFPRYDNGKGIMAQTIYNDKDDTITVILINYRTYNIEVILYDKDIKIIWDKTARYTQINGPKTKTVTVSGSKATIITNKQSIITITGKYRSNPSTKITEYEFGPMDESQIMKGVGYKTNSIDFTINIPVKNIPSGLNAEYGYIKFGMLHGAITDFKWTIKVKIGTTTYLTKSNYIQSMNYIEFPIISPAFFNKISTNDQMVNIQFIGTRIVYPGNYWKNYPKSGKISFASLVLGGSIKSSYIKITNGVNLNKFYYAAKLSNIPKGIKINWIKMKCETCTLWQDGSYNKNNGYYEWKNGPYSAPLSFQIRSVDGQTIYSWNVISTLNDKDYGRMKQTFGAPFASSNVSNQTGLYWNNIIAIIIICILLIGFNTYCIWNRKKMKKQISFHNEEEEQVISDNEEEMLMKIESSIE